MNANQARSGNQQAVTEALRAIGVIFEPGDVIEIRALDVGRNEDYAGSIRAGYFNFENSDAMAAAIRSVDGDAEGVYVVLNRFDPELLARSSNRLRVRAKNTTKDADILEWRWLYIDADAVRPAGMSATDAEHSAALEKILSIRQFLSERGWPDPIHGDSGNGGHLLYRLPVLEIKEAGDLVKRCLKALSARFSDSQVTVDESTATAARLCKLYGTMARKGDSTGTRPHRRSALIDTPERNIPVTVGDLQALAAEVPSKSENRNQPGGGSFDVDLWITTHSLEITKGPEPYEGGRRWTLPTCFFNPEHQKPVLIQYSSGKVIYKCLHNSCSQNGWKALQRLIDPGSHVTRTIQSVPNLLSFPHTDTGNAERLLLLYGCSLRFCIEMKKWLLWDGRRWSMADARRVKQLFTKTVRAMYEQAADIADKNQREAAEKHARRSESANMISAALMCAECEEAVCVSAEALDSHPYLLNCLNGTLDLQTGSLRAHDREDLITQLVHVCYRADATCPKFLQFLHRIMGRNPGTSTTASSGSMIAYLQRCFGYSLTADVSEKVVFCFFGSGNNGKTTLLEIVRFILSEYSTQVLVDTLMAHKSRDSSASLADLADLRGARFVTTSEPEEGGRLAVAKIKYLTQGSGELKTCRKYENPISFLATHKLYLDSNHRPVVRGSDKAIWNRLKPIAFETTIPLKEIDRQLLGKLKEEAEGILAWMVEGCLAWMRDGLGEPPEVSEAATSWENESDHFLTFWNERYTRHSSGWVAVAEIWANYTVWCDSRPEESRLAKTQFDMRLRGMGFQEARRNSGTVRAWVGLEARNLEDSDGDKVTPGDTKC